ncbi:MAG: NUDIX hydrolase [Acidobacteria bacterium]|nr:NUDIX hydrolase [Acidobacteriota bacterium]
MTEPVGIVKSTKTIHRGRVFDVASDRVLMPHGREVTLDIIRHPPSVVLLPMKDAEHLVLVRQYRYAIDRWIWELPAGSIDTGETPDQAAARECREEIGVHPGRVELLASFYPTPGYCDELMLFFRVAELADAAGSGFLDARDEDEALTVEVFSVSEVRGLITRGEIQDMKTAVGMTLI